MPFYKDNQKAILYKDNYEPANAYGPGGSYAVKYENILNPVAASYGSTYERFEALGDGSFKVTRLSATTAGWHYGMNFNKTYELKASHKYYFQIDCYVNRLPSSTTQLCTEDYFNGQWMSPQLPTAANEWQTIYKFGTGWSSWDPSQLRNRILLWHVMTDSQGFEDGDYYMVRRPIFIDLTDAFGSGYEPTTQQELYAALPQLANGGYMPPTKATTLEHTYIPTKVSTAYWIGENCNVHWNMINGNNCASITHQGITYTNNQNGSWTINGTSTGYSFKNIKSDLLKWLRNSHKYLIYCKGLKDTYTDDDGLGLRVLTSPDTTFGKRMINTDYYIFTTPTDMESLGTNDIFRWCTGTAGHTYDNVTLWPQLFDLTEMFGAGYEPTIDEFKAMYPNDYYPYDESYSPYTSVGNRITAYKGNNYVNFRNQAITRPAETRLGITTTKNSDGSINIHGTCTQTPTYRQFSITTGNTIRRDGSKYLYRFNKSITVTDPQTVLDGQYGVDGYGSKSIGSFIFSVVADGTWVGNAFIYLSAGTTIDVDNLFVECFNLTDMFGKGKEPTIEQFNLLFPNTYYKYTDSTYIRDVKGYDTQLTLPGGPLYFNQINKSNWASSAEGGVTYTNNSDGSWTINGTCTATARGNIMWTSGSTFLKNNHVYLVYCKGLSNHSHDPSDLGLRLLTSPDSTFNKVFAQDDYFVFTAPSNIESLTGHLFRWCVSYVGSTFDNVKLYPHLIDLTAMYGYGNEPTLAQCRQLFTGLYYPYTTSKLIPAQVRKDLYRVNFNQIVNTTSPGDPSTKCGITLTKEWTNNSFICTATGTSTAWSGDPNWYVNCHINQIQGHKYYVRFNGGQLASMYLNSGWTTHPVTDSIGAVVTANVTTLTNNGVTVRFQEHTLTEGTVVNETFAIEIIDLTQTFGAGKEPDNVYILNELFGHTFLPYTTSMWVDSPNNIITETPSQITKMLAGYRTVQKQGYEISVDGTYNDPFVCTYYPEQSTQLTSTGANKVDLVNYAGTAGLEVLPDGSFKWTRTSGTRSLAKFTNPDGTNLTITAGQTFRLSCFVDSFVMSTGDSICSLQMRYSDDTYWYKGVITKQGEGIWRTVTGTPTKDVVEIIMYIEGTSAVGDYVIFKDFQLEIDTNVGQYEPYTSQLPAPTPTNMLPISYNKSQKIVLDCDNREPTFGSRNMLGIGRDYNANCTLLSNNYCTLKSISESGFEIYTHTNIPASTDLFKFYARPKKDYDTTTGARIVVGEKIIVTCDSGVTLTDPVYLYIHSVGYKDAAGTKGTHNSGQLLNLTPLVSTETRIIHNMPTYTYASTDEYIGIRLFTSSAIPAGLTIKFSEIIIEEAESVGDFVAYNGVSKGPYTNYNFPITSDAKLIWKPSDYSTDFTYGVYHEGTAMKKRVGTDYVQLIPLLTASSASSDTAWMITTSNFINLEANKTYCLVFKHKRINCKFPQLQTGTSGYASYLIDESGAGTSALEIPYLIKSSRFNTADDEGWSWARFTAPTAGNYKVRIGADTPNMHKVIEDRGSYIQFTDIALYEGELQASNQSNANLQAVLSDGNKQTIVSNKELGYVTRAGYGDYISTLEPYVKDTNNEWKSTLNQNTGVITYTGTENWALLSGKLHTFQCSSHNFIINGGYCTHFPLMTSPSDIDVRTSVYLLWSSPVIITKMDCDSVADFKAFLAAEYNKGTPVTILTGRGTNKLTTYNNPLLAHTLPYHTDINTDANYITAYIKESL